MPGNYERRDWNLPSQFFSLRPGLIVGDEPMKLYLLNNGGVAKDVKIDTFINGKQRNLFFVTSIPTNGEVDLDIELDDMRRKNWEITVVLSYKTSYGKELGEFLSLDYRRLFKNERKLGYNYTATEKMLMDVSNGLNLLHSDAENGKFKSNNITVYPQEKPQRKNRK